MIRPTDVLKSACDFMLSGIAFAHKPDKAEYAEWSQSFTNTTLSSPLDLMDVVTGGYAYCATHTDNIRRKEHWQSAQYISIDLENHADASLNAVEDNPFFSAYGFMSYTTYSHTEEKPRSCALFVLDKPVTDVTRWHYAARAIMGMFGDAADQCSADISRAFMGNPNTQCRVYARILPWDVAFMLGQQQKLLDEQKELSRQRENRPLYQQEGASLASLSKWIDDVSRATEGKRNNTLNRAVIPHR